MPDITGPPLVGFAGGMYSGRLEMTMREEAQMTYYNLTSVDAGPLGTGANITSAQTSQTNGYQIQASNTLFSAVSGVLTLTVTAGGSGYTGSTFTAVPVTGGSGSGLTVSGTISGGVVQAGATVVAPGVGYKVGDVVTPVIPGGSGAQLTIATISAAACILPQTYRPQSFAGLVIYIANTSVNAINCYPHPSDPSNSINGQSVNASVYLAVSTTTLYHCFPPRIWFADGIGTGYSGSLETIITQGNASTNGSNAGTATPITQNSVNFTSITTGTTPTTGGTLMPARSGLQVAVANNTGSTITAYPNGTDTINGANSGVTITTAIITLFFSFANGAWLTK